MKFRLPRFLMTLLSLLATPFGAGAQDGTTIEMKAIAGLRFDPPRFQVAPGAKVKLVLENADDMAHNLVIVAPGARPEIVNAAMTMPITPTADFIPKSEKVLWAVPVLVPGKSATLEFTAPAAEGVYPFVCTYPGHGLVMFGAMYVGAKAMPAIARDTNLPDMVREAGEAKRLHAFAPQPPYLYRTFMRDSGPASIAVALPGGQNYCWDAGACRLRYAWSGGFVDPMPHWSGNGDAFSEVKGRIYYRSGAAFPLRIGGKAPTVVKFRGYRLVERYPEFRYEVDGVEVRELIKALHHGAGLVQTFTVAAAAPVTFLADEGAVFSTSVGAFSKDGVLELTAEQAKSFTITRTEIPGREPLGYWSMDDVLTDKKPVPVPGVKGRALVFDGKKSQFATGISTDALAKGATFALWVKVTNPNARDQVVIGGHVGTEEEFVLGWNLSPESEIFGFMSKIAGRRTGSSGDPVDSHWHHLAFTAEGGKITAYFDGQKRGWTLFTLPTSVPIFLGSSGGAQFAAATLDEVRIYDRVLSDAEIRALFIGERAKQSPEAAK